MSKIRIIFALNIILQLIFCSYKNNPTKKARQSAGPSQYIQFMSAKTLLPNVIQPETTLGRPSDELQATYILLLPLPASFTLNISDAATSTRRDATMSTRYMRICDESPVCGEPPLEPPLEPPSADSLMVSLVSATPSLKKILTSCAPDASVSR